MSHTSWSPDAWSVNSILGPAGTKHLVTPARALLSFDWSETLRLVSLENGSSFPTERAAFEFARFLLLAAHEKGSTNLSPSDKVDKVWHTLLLAPASYSKLCTSICGILIDHYPLRAYGPPAERSMRLTHTVAQYQSVFGEAAPADVWGEGEACYEVRSRRRLLALLQLQVNKHMVG
jgi:hypothetical protein